MENYPSNSKRSKEEKAESKSKPVERVKAKKIVQGKVELKKKSEFRKIIGAFIAEDIGNVKDIVIQEIVIPTIQQGILESIGIVFGIDARGFYRRDSNRRSGERVSYGKYYDTKDTRKNDRDSGYRRRETLDFGDVSVESKSEALDVLDNMAYYIEEYGYCTVTDLYDMLGKTPPTTGIDYGWESMSSIRHERTFGGEYRLMLPRPVLLDRR